MHLYYAWYKLIGSTHQPYFIAFETGLWRDCAECCASDLRRQPEYNII